jgi:predicted Zn-dependent protease
MTVKTYLRRLMGEAQTHPARFVLWALLTSALLAAGGWEGLHYYSDYHLRQAEQAMERYDFEAAEQHLAACLRVHPRSARLHFEMARAARRAEHYEQASEHLQRCRQLQAKGAEIALESILFQAQCGRIAEVEKLLQREVDQENPDADLILEAMAKGYVQIYRLDAAMYCLNRLLSRQPDNLAALLLRASMWKAAGNFPQAEEDCRRAVEAQPQHRAARLQYGELLLLTKQADKARTQFEYLRQLPGGEAAEVLVGLARSHRQLGEVEAARRLLDAVLERQPHDGMALLERGKIALETEAPADAEKWLRQAVADYPYDGQAHFLLAQALLKQNKEEEARIYEAAHKRIEADWKALEEAFHRVVKNPRDPGPRLQAGLICLRNGRADEGERWLLSALEQAPDHAATRAALAEHYQRIGKTDLAELYGQPVGKGLSQLQP